MKMSLTVDLSFEEDIGTTVSKLEIHNQRCNHDGLAVLEHMIFGLFRGVTLPLDSSLRPIGL